MVIYVLYSAEEDGLHVTIGLSTGMEEYSFVPWHVLRAMMEFMRNGK